MLHNMIGAAIGLMALMLILGGEEKTIVFAKKNSVKGMSSFSEKTSICNCQGWKSDSV